VEDRIKACVITTSIQVRACIVRFAGSIRSLSTFLRTRGLSPE
jgi:hypothetical protein